MPHQEGRAAWDEEVDIDKFRKSTAKKGHYLSMFGLDLAEYRSTEIKSLPIHKRDGKWYKGVGKTYSKEFDGVARPLLNASIIAGHTAIVVEGNKCSQELTRWLWEVQSETNIIPVSWIGGVNAVGLTDFEPLKKAARIILWADNDPAGRAAMCAVQKAVGRECDFIQIEGADEKFDAADAIADDKWSNEELLRVIKSAQPLTPQAFKEWDKNADKEKEKRLSSIIADGEDECCVFMNHMGATVTIGKDEYVVPFDYQPRETGRDNYSVANNKRGDFQPVIACLKPIPQYKQLHKSKRVVIIDSEGNRKIRNAVDVWLEHPQRAHYNGLEYLPGKSNQDNPPGVVCHPDSEDSYDAPPLRTWLPLAFPPSDKPKDQRHPLVEVVEDYMLKLICRGDKQLCDYIMQFFGRKIKYPDKPNQLVFAVFSDAQGIGKSLTAKLLMSILGTYNCFEGRGNRDLTDRFSASVANAGFYIGDEVHGMSEEEFDSLKQR